MNKTEFDEIKVNDSTSSDFFNHENLMKGSIAFMSAHNNLMIYIYDLSGGDRERIGVLMINRENAQVYNKVVYKSLHFALEAASDQIAEDVGYFI